jgi:hypothetical protein
MATASMLCVSVVYAAAAADALAAPAPSVLANASAAAAAAAAATAAAAAGLCGSHPPALRSQLGLCRLHQRCAGVCIDRGGGGAGSLSAGFPLSYSHCVSIIGAAMQTASTLCWSMYDFGGGVHPDSLNAGLLPSYSLCDSITGAAVQTASMLCRGMYEAQMGGSVSVWLQFYASSVWVQDPGSSRVLNVTVS